MSKVSYLECIADERAEKSMQNDVEDDVLSCEESSGIPIEYAKTLDKAYWFFKDGYIQDIKFHPMPNLRGSFVLLLKCFQQWGKIGYVQ